MVPIYTEKQWSYCVYSSKVNIHVAIVCTLAIYWKYVPGNTSKIHSCTSSVYDTSELSDKVQTIEIENNGITVATYLTVVVAHNYQSSRM